MAIIKAKYKFDRTINSNLFGRSKSPIFKRNYKPGQHGLSKRRKKISEFGEKVLEKKKVKLFYGGLRYKDLSKVVKEAIQKKGKSDNHIVQILESRLSSVVYRAKWAATPFAARQIVNHGHVSVNGKKVDICSYRVKINDKITLSKTTFENSHVVAAIKSTERNIPEYLSITKNEAVYLGANIQNTIYPVPIKFTNLIEFFSR